MFTRVKNAIYGIFFDLDKYKKGGERQAGFDLNSISKDHKERYKFASSLLPKDGKILDMACGVGYGSFILANDSDERRVRGVDISADAIEFANKFYGRKNIDFSNQDATKATFSEAGFDCGVCFETIEHVPSDVDVLKSYHRLLKQGAKFLISHPNEVRLPYSQERFPYHVRHYTEGEMTTILENSGFKIDKVYSQNSKTDYKITEGKEGSFLIYLCTKN